MAPRREAIVPNSWASFYAETAVPAAVRQGAGVYFSGHTGCCEDGSFDPDPKTQIRQTFRNITDALEEIGADWSNVVALRSYQIGLRGQAEVMLQVAAEFLEAPFPAWTAVGVTELFEADAVFELECFAIIE
jgi:enamine deaminase RidA (YjgF/YER057c/UK114 family)